MAFTNSVVFSFDLPAVVDSVVTSSVVVGEAVGAKEAANVEGTTVITVDIKVAGVVANSLCLD